MTLQYVALVTLSYISYIKLHYVALRYITLHDVTVRCISYIKLHFVTLCCITLHYVTLRCNNFTAKSRKYIFFAEYFFTSSLSKDAVNNPDCKASGEAMRIENFVDAEHGLIKVTVLEFSRNSSRIVCAVPTFET